MTVSVNLYHLWWWGFALVHLVGAILVYVIWVKRKEWIKDEDEDLRP